MSFLLTPMTHHVRAEALSMVAGLRYDLRALTLRGPEDRSYIVPLAQVWAALPGRPRSLPAGAAAMAGFWMADATTLRNCLRSTGLVR